MLGLTSGIAKKDWDKTGVWPYPEDYSSGVYNNAECDVNAAEKELFTSIEKEE